MIFSSGDACGILESMDSQAIGIEQPPAREPRKTSGWRILGALLVVAAFCLLPSLPEEFRLASLGGRWVPVFHEQGTSPSGLTWEVRSGAGSGGDFRSLKLTRKGQEVFSWRGNSDELFGSLRVYRDEASSEPRFLCYQPLTTGPHTRPSEVRYGTWLVESESCRPIVTNAVSQLIRNPSALLGWGEVGFPAYSPDAGLLDHP